MFPFTVFLLGGCKLPSNGVLLMNADRIASVGDVDGTGRSDHAVLKLSTMVDGHANLYYGDLYLYTDHRFRKDQDYSSQKTFNADVEIDLALGVSQLYEHQFTTAGDLDGDGMDELLFSACYGGGACNVSLMQLIFGRTSWPAEIKESDNDVLIYTVNDAGSPWFEALGDLDGDGLDDLLVSGSLGFGLGILPGSADRWGGELTESDFVPLNSEANVAAAGDLNGDGIMDLMIQDNDESISLAMGSAELISAGELNVTLPVIDTALDDPFFHRAGDLNCDGLSDLILYTSEYVIKSNSTDLDSLEVLFGQEGDLSNLQTVQVQFSETIPMRSLSVGGDLDRDGCADLVVSTNDELMWFSGVDLADSSGPISPYQQYMLPDEAVGFLGFIDDVGGNGMADIVLSVLDGYLLIEGS